MKTLITLGLILALAVPAMAQAPAEQATEQTNELQQAVELENMKKQIADLQRKLQAATANERTAARKKLATDISEAVKKEYAESCSQAGGRWAWLQATINNQATTLVGCVGK
jgi:hypothetical protein